ncbi:hypothetical protein VNO78_12149 [Psophocarpus tetragonolobus]|uniref:Uncharacterized protein n=1 Tax=Psophocarpus tetragonolobus TaxID=3891 RepID=A0AAN9XP06_PSOTE
MQVTIAARKRKVLTSMGVPTKVLLRNMVGPGEVDDELEDEVGSECATYETVIRVLIFEITTFVQFERSEETTTAPDACLIL